MKVGILSQWYDPEPGSAAVAGVLARALRARGNAVQVLTGFPNYPTGRIAPGYRLRWRQDEKDEAGVAIRRVALVPSHDRSGWHRFLNYSSFAVSAAATGMAKLREQDAVWVYNSPATVGLPSWLASSAGGPPHLMHVMDLWPDSIRFSGMASSTAFSRMERILDRWCRFTYRRASGIACISRTMLAELEHRGAPAEKLRYIPIWTDERHNQPRPRDSDLARSLGVEDAFVLLYAGNLGESQGLASLLEVCHRLTDLEGFHCLIAGSGTAEEHLRAKASDLRLSNVTFLGRWPSSDIGRLLSLGDLHLVSLRRDPLSALALPSKVPAILASARPLLVAAEGEAARVVAESKAGWSVAPGDVDAYEAALREAYNQTPDGMQRLGRLGHEYYQREFSVERGVAAVEDFLSTLANA
jgi:colanic acid biosynthesis glycosyl transferase WcaI